MKSALVIRPDRNQQITSFDMSSGFNINLFGTQTNSEMKAPGLSGFTMVYYGVNNQPNNTNDINTVGMAWMPPHDNEYVVGNVAFVKKKGTVTDEDVQTIYNKQRSNDPYDGAKKHPPQQMMCCTIL
eukprot:227686_1